MTDEVTTHSQVDGGETAFGHGWYSGVIGILLGGGGLAAVLCLHFPNLLTTPELRSHYRWDVIRAILHLVLVGGFFFSTLSLVLRPQKVLGMTGLGFTLVAALLGGSRVQLEGSLQAEGPFLGLDWFLLNLLVWSAVFIPLERLYAQRPEQPIFRRGWRTDLMYFFVSALGLQLVTLMTLKPATILFQWTVASSFRETVAAQPWWLQVIEILVITDLVQYWIHRMFHQVPWLWRFHAIHHSTPNMDWLAGSRLHIVDVVVTRGLTYMPLFVLGFEIEPMGIYAAIVTIQATFIHANVRFRFGFVKYLLATPQFHHWHHGSDADAVDKNFSVHLPLWDILFGTFHLPTDKWPNAYGVTGEQPPESFLRQLVYPFQSAAPKNREENQ